MKLTKRNAVQFLLYLLLTAGLVIVVMPFCYMISTSLKPNGALYEFPPHFFPSLKEITLENYDYILHQGKFYMNFLNSVLVSGITVAIAAFVAAALGFCIARFRFPGRSFLFLFIILTMIIPGTTLIVPQYELAVKLKVINNLWGLIPFYVAWVIPYSTFMIKGFVENVPKELDEAIYMDGGGVFTVFFRIVFPLAKPGIASVSIFNFLTAWEEFPWANTVINDNLKRTLPIAISGFFGQHQFTQWGYVFALSVLSLLPILIIFIFCQKFFVAGLTAGSVKG
ncbi:carbohydrate ABC transporter permease [Eisenbergiella tayi]|uniref:L-arabinose transport system permease protein AraQ n=1 Tax=Eisenbergiella tayi TaxID=1432052 RepID=A0A1E3A183_9FIRM|nr:carbohydrate ABC transporter permease [Eisenbergiella tayi]ODM02508.1 L-arabinose transport system permease protein AraQ [Eisenbergiella tayi]